MSQQHKRRAAGQLIRQSNKLKWTDMETNKEYKITVDYAPENVIMNIRDVIQKIDPKHSTELGETLFLKLRRELGTTDIKVTTESALDANTIQTVVTRTKPKRGGKKAKKDEEDEEAEGGEGEDATQEREEEAGVK